ncbi:MAG TPA: LytTR family DNA-binding domain-containing protein [Longimicrobium sp.]
MATIPRFGSIVRRPRAGARGRGEPEQEETAGHVPHAEDAAGISRAPEHGPSPFNEPAARPGSGLATASVHLALDVCESLLRESLRHPADRDAALAAVAKAREIAIEHSARLDDVIGAALAGSGRGAAPVFPRRLAIRVADQHRFVDVAEIRFIEGDRGHVKLHLAGGTRIANQTLKEFAERILDPNEFVRIHRSIIVNLSEIVFVESLFHGDLVVVLRDGTRLTCSRRFKAQLQAKVHFTN